MLTIRTLLFLFALLPVLSWAQGPTIGRTARRPSADNVRNLYVDQTTGVLMSIGRTGPATAVPIDSGAVIGLRDKFQTTTTELARRATAATAAQIRTWSGTLPATFYVVTKGRTGNFTRDDTDNSSADNEGTVIVAPGGVRYKRDRRAGELRASWFGMAGDGVTLDDNAYNQLKAAINAEPSGKVDVLFESGANYRFQSGIEIDLSKVMLHASGSRLSFPTLGSGIAVKVIGAPTDVLAQEQSTRGLEALMITGPGQSNTATVGLSFGRTGSEGGSSHLSVRAIIIMGFGTGVQIGDNSYILKFANCGFHQNARGLYMPLGVSNAGEGIGFVQCSFYNSALAIQQSSPDADIYLTDCSIDYNGRQVLIDNGLVEATGCHFEGKRFSLRPFSVSGSGGRLVIRGGRILSTDSTNNTVKPDYLFEVNTAPNTNLGVTLRDVFINNIQTSSNFYATGPGRFTNDSWASYETHLNPLFSSTINNTLIDGSFEQSVVADNWWVTASGRQTSRLSVMAGDNTAEVSASIATTSPRTGSQSLKWTKKFGASGPATLNLVQRIVPGRPFAAQFYYSKPGSSSGPLFITYSYAAGVSADVNGFPTATRTQTIGSITETLPSSAVTNKQVVFFGQLSTLPPSWATDVILSINGVSWTGSGESIYIDDVHFDQGGYFPAGGFQFTPLQYVLKGDAARSLTRYTSNPDQELASGFYSANSFLLTGGSLPADPTGVGWWNITVVHHETAQGDGGFGVTQTATAIRGGITYKRWRSDANGWSVWTRVHDNEYFNVDAMSPATGDLLYYDGTKWTRLPAGSNGQFLKMVNGKPAWSN